MSKEEAIKELEKLASQKYDEKLLNSLHMITEEDETYILTIFERQAIETVLNYIKELEADNYASNNIINEQIDLLKDSIPKSKIRDKIEELKKERQKIESSPYDKWDLYKVIGKIEVLKDLLEEE